MEVVNIEKKYFKLLNDLRSFNDVFRKNVTCDNILKVTKNQGFKLFLESKFLEIFLGLNLMCVKLNGCYLFCSLHGKCFTL